MRSKNAFTLLELLAVITIILVLSAMLLPVMNSAKEAANKDACTSNLHQIATAIVLYRQQYDGDGTYGDMYQMGLPNAPLYGSLPITRTLNRCAGADQLPNLAPNGFPYIFVPTPPGTLSGTESWSEYATQYGEQSVVIVDMNHNPAGTPWDAIFLTKFGLGACLDTHVERRLRTGSPWDLPVFWNSN